MRPRDDKSLTDALEAMGVSEDEIRESRDSSAVEVWPDAVDPLRLFNGLMTQWRMGPGGPIGIDYAVVPMVAREIAGIRPRRLRELWWHLRVMESEALAVISEQAKEAMKK